MKTKIAAKALIIAGIAALIPGAVIASASEKAAPADEPAAVTETVTKEVTTEADENAGGLIIVTKNGDEDAEISKEFTVSFDENGEYTADGGEGYCMVTTDTDENGETKSVTRYFKCYTDENGESVSTEINGDEIDDLSGTFGFAKGEDGRVIFGGIGNEALADGSVIPYEMTIGSEYDDLTDEEKAEVEALHKELDDLFKKAGEGADLKAVKERADEIAAKITELEKKAGNEFSFEFHIADDADEGADV